MIITNEMSISENVLKELFGQLQLGNSKNILVKCIISLDSIFRFKLSNTIKVNICAFLKPIDYHLTILIIISEEKRDEI